MKEGEGHNKLRRQQRPCPIVEWLAYHAGDRQECQPMIGLTFLAAASRDHVRLSNGSPITLATAKNVSPIIGHVARSATQNRCLVTKAPPTTPTTSRAKATRSIS